MAAIARRYPNVVGSRPAMQDGIVVPAACLLDEGFLEGEQMESFLRELRCSPSLQIVG